MHLPDGLLNTATWTSLSVVAAGGLACVLRQTKVASAATFPATPSITRTPLIGLAAAFTFAAQMVNFPVASAVSGHLLGGTLLAILLGPSIASLVMTAVLIIQALLLQDGGITALGANIVNLAFIATWSGYLLYRVSTIGLTQDRQGLRRARFTVGVFVAAWCSAVLSAGAAAGELALSGVAPFSRLLPLLLGSHALIGIGEGLVTVAVLRYLFALGMVPAPQQTGKGLPTWLPHHG